MNTVAKVGLSCPLSHWHNSSDYKILHLEETTCTSFNGDTTAADGKDARKNSSPSKMPNFYEEW